MSDTINPSRDIARLIEIMAALRTPVTGCPWDLEQTFASIAPYTIEEAYEVADAIERSDLADLNDELGDLLLQVVYHARMAEEAGAFSFGDVVLAVTRKMIRRHPHVFGSPEQRAAGAEPGFWARIKAEEKAEKAAAHARLHSPARQDMVSSVLGDVPATLPGLTRAVKLQDKAAKAGFDWPSLAPVFDKLKEELAEFEEVALPADPRGDAPSPAPSGAWLRQDVGEAPRGGGGQAPVTERSGHHRAAIMEEFGDLLFVMANVARHLQIDPETALRAANQKFVRRFAHIEKRLAAQGKTPAQSNLAEMDAFWDEARAADKSGKNTST